MFIQHTIQSSIGSSGLVSTAETPILNSSEELLLIVSVACASRSMLEKHSPGKSVVKFWEDLCIYVLAVLAMR